MDVQCVEGKIVAQHQSRFVTMESRPARGARGTFIAPYDYQTPRRSPRLRSTLVRVALKKSRGAMHVDIFESAMRMSADPAYSHVRRPSS